MIQKKIAIIGGGVSGLAAGIYAQKNGFDSAIYERHSVVGGQCTGWFRNGFLIDNCVHWLTGTNPEKDIYKIWCDVGVLGKDVEIIRHASFLQLQSTDGQSVDLWRDKEQLHTSLLKFSPEDKEAIDEFIMLLDAYRAVVLPSFKPSEQFNLKDYWYLLKKMRRLGPIHSKYSKMSIPQYVERFKHPLLRQWLLAYMPESYNVSSLFYVFATFIDGNGDLPRGGSLGMIQRMEEKYLALGGKIHTHYEADKIHVSKRLATSVTFTNGKEAVADYVVCACDTNVLFNRLLANDFLDKYFTQHYAQKKNYPVYSSFNCYFSVDGKCDEMSNTTVFQCEDYHMGAKTYDHVLVKNFDYEPSFSPEGKSVLQTLLIQYEDDFDYWKKLYETDRESYKKEKLKAAEQIQKRIEKQFPKLGTLSILDAVTPMSFYRFCGAYKGAYMSFILTPFVPKRSHRGRLIGVKNLYLAGQWLQPPGGLPNAVLTGKFAIQRLCKQEKVKFNQLFDN